MADQGTLPEGDSLVDHQLERLHRLDGVDLAALDAAVELARGRLQADDLRGLAADGCRRFSGEAWKLLVLRKYPY